MSRKNRRRGKNTKKATSDASKDSNHLKPPATSNQRTSEATASSSTLSVTTLKPTTIKIQRKKPGRRSRAKWKRGKISVKPVKRTIKMPKPIKPVDTWTSVNPDSVSVNKTEEIEPVLIPKTEVKQETDIPTPISSDIVPSENEEIHEPMETDNIVEEKSESEEPVSDVDNLDQVPKDLEDSEAENNRNNTSNKKDFDSPVALSHHAKHNSSHNTSNGNQIHKCLVCSKILSSASSLDRHMLVHSGERPFKCKICDMAFTTNGNMHRHMRTHAEAGDIPDGIRGVDLRKREAAKQKLNFDLLNGTTSANDQEKLVCPVCGKSLLCRYGLQSHMETHPNDPIRCQTCGAVSSNYTAHVNHKCNAEAKKLESMKSTCCSFQDLNFMDFTTNKFSLVSKSVCEQNMKRPSSEFHVFECSECKRAFPCSRALKLHMSAHDNNNGTFCASCNCNFESQAFLQLHQLKHRATKDSKLKSVYCSVLNQMPDDEEDGETEGVKEDFLALFNLQTKESQISLLKGLRARKVKENNFENMDYFVHAKRMTSKSETEPNRNNISNDFADIQSIISLTSKAPLIADVHTSPSSGRPMSPITVIPSQQPDSPQEADQANSSPETPSIHAAVQPASSSDSVPDVIPVIVNPIYACKICNQKFRSINMLKRHSKMHVQRGSNYSCHLCSYVSVDKSTLIRHLRTHNGERPFQCTICKYAFTTKANCERHVRKRHKKQTKPEIRNCMQYNPNMALKVPDLSPTEISNSETVCKYCNVDFKFNRVLRHHLRSLHNSCNRKPFSCKICSFGFSTKNNCIRHVLKQHPFMKDKLRSVVIPNSQKVSLSIKNFEPKVEEEVIEDETDTEEPPVSVVPESEGSEEMEQMEPLDLNCHDSEQPLNLCRENQASKSNSEVVIAAESLVSLSEAIPLQHEPLDLAVRPLDLSCKSEPLVINRSSPRIIAPNNNVQESTSSCQVLDLGPPNRSSSLNLDRFPKSSGSDASRSSLESLSQKVSASLPQEIIPKVVETPLAFGQKYRAFTCVYCSAGFTLKSNMERHIKRKHPEYARPTRSRNFIPTVIAHRTQRNNLNMLSDKTRDALRHVLNTKGQQSMPCPRVFGTNPVLTNMYSASKERRYENAFPIHDKHSKGDSSASTSSNDSQHTNTEAENLVLRTSASEDENSNGLASVSSVICLANSQQFNQYFEKPENKEDPSEMMESTSMKDGSSSNVESNISCPFCSRKFPWTSSLRRHILTHTGQKPFKCPKCVLWFTTKSNCERHLIRKHGHKGDLIYRTVPDRPFKCTQCPSSTFSTQGNLRKHFYLKHWTKSYMGMNTKIPNETMEVDEPLESIPVSTDSASEVLTTVQSTKEHSYSQTEKKRMLNCNFCTQKFGEIAQLSMHMQRHKNVIYMCYLCRKTFPTSGGCYSHFKTSHSLVYLQMSNTEVTCNDAAEDKDVSMVDSKEPSQNSSGTSTMACMICYQRISSLENLQHHVKKHMQVPKPTSEGSDVADVVPTVKVPSSDTPKKDVADKKPRSKSRVQNSLLYLFNPSANGPSTSLLKSSEVKVETSEDGDLIQNLLGIHDSKMIDEMLVSADSAARLLGVKEV